MSTTPDIAAEESAWPRFVDAALFRWDNEGGAGPEGAQDHAPVSQRDWLTASARDELALLRGRVMASMPLLMAVLASASDRHMDNIREMGPDVSNSSRDALQLTDMPAFIQAHQMATPVGFFPVVASA